MTLPFWRFSPSMGPWCSGHHYSIISFKEAWNQVLRGFKSCPRRVEGLRWWGSLKKTNYDHHYHHHHHHHHRHHLRPFSIIATLLVLQFLNDLYHWLGGIKNLIQRLNNIIMLNAKYKLGGHQINIYFQF